MKTKLLSLSLFLLVLIGYAQAPITVFDTPNGSLYNIVTPGSAIDQSSTGANASWTFNNLNDAGDSTDTYAAPTSQELTDYPETTSVYSVNNIVDNAKIYRKITGSQPNQTIEYTGLIGQGITLKYSTDKALLGTLPFNYSSTATNDAISGTFSETISGFGATGTFTGTIVTNVDAYGVLQMNVSGSGSYSGNVTRLKIEQNVLLMPNAPFNGVTDATAKQISYHYYDDSTGELVFRSTEAALVSPSLMLNNSAILYESLNTATLSTSNVDISENTLSIFPNPVKGDLNIGLSNEFNISSILISDISGREILKINNDVRTFSVELLSSGLYIATVNTNKGSLSRKFIKE